jgi:hypothetical protein
MSRSPTARNRLFRARHDPRSPVGRRRSSTTGGGRAADRCARGPESGSCRCASQCGRDARSRHLRAGALHRVQDLRLDVDEIRLPRRRGHARRRLFGVLWSRSVRNSPDAPAKLMPAVTPPVTVCADALAVHVVRSAAPKESTNRIVWSCPRSRQDSRPCGGPKSRAARCLAGLFRSRFGGGRLPDSLSGACFGSETAGRSRA